MAIHLALRSPQIRGNLHWLARQRELLGEGPFRAAMRKHLDGTDVSTVEKLLDQFTSA